MIVPMKKLSIVVLEKERRQALKTLRRLGVVHVEEVKGESEELSSFKNKNSKRKFQRRQCFQKMTHLLLQTKSSV